MTMTTSRSQRDMMRDLVRLTAGNVQAATEMYASAEQHGLVERRSNLNEVPAVAYASALYADGIAKGWLA